MDNRYNNFLAVERFGNALALNGAVSSSGGDLLDVIMKQCRVCGAEIVNVSGRNQRYCYGQCQIVGARRVVQERLERNRLNLPGTASSRAVILTGQRFGKLLVIGRSCPPIDKGHNRMWNCRCDCGKEIIRATCDLLSRCRHCGCSLPSGPESKTWIGFGKVSGSILCMIRKSAADRGREFNLTCEDLWNLYQNQHGLCAISGVPIILRKISQARSNVINSASLDRIDSTKGYTASNVQWTSLAINYMKRNHTEADFIRLCRTAVNFQDGKAVAQPEAAQ